MGILLYVERKKYKNILCWLAAGALIKIYCSEKVLGALIGVGALKGMNTVSLLVNQETTLIKTKQCGIDYYTKIN